ncbi:L-lactate permease [Glycomyces sp. TRM65418]|uniref:L-lactate permease n=1 Tax=Glycomyces sp. TRM65418 TaxID=2867006 RepID=UPI001CE52E4B|nr:L-lactate permease [Glycomyces sp. TRM65418]MCC3761583.1 L-lactate permease [Glycomyces sp. TRM65418]QZD55678.1 L-lactate permease [Glycomyces sp. TRM65418]
MITLAAVSPLLFALAATAVFRRPAHLAAVLGVAVTAAVVVLVPHFGAAAGELGRAMAAAGLITLSAAVVIGPGLYLNQQLTERKVHTRLVQWTETLPLDAPRKSALIVVGLAPALESMTGFGVSLLVTVPLLMAVTDRPKALRQSLLSMNIMPWGTLGLATLVGAALAGRSTTDLALGTAVVSAAVFPLFGALSAALAAAPGRRWTAAVSGGLLGAVFSAFLVAFNWLGIVELAGVLAGLTAVVLGLLIFAGGRPVTLPPWEVVRPYAIVFALVALIRFAPLVGVPVERAAVAAGDVSFNPLSSPGLALMAAVLILGRSRFERPLLAAAGSRAWKPILALGGFTVMAQLMLAGGMVQAISEALPVETALGFVFLSVLVGMASGYLTGSGVGGNALMMPMQSGIGQDLGDPLLFSAIQNSAAGHTVFASMPIVLLVLAIAGGAERGEDTKLIRFSLLTAVPVYAALTLGALTLYGLVD